jgi:hypothetical protein
MSVLLMLQKFSGPMICIILALLAGCSEPEPAQVSHRPSPYRYPLYSPGTQFGDLPAAVQHTIRAQTGSAEIADIKKQTNLDEVIYKVYFARRLIFPPLLVAHDGSVLNPDLSVAVPAPAVAPGSPVGAESMKAKLNDLPAEVLKALKQRAPDAEITSIDKEIWGNGPVYIFAFKDEKRYQKLYIASDGSVRNEVPK